jgi:Cu2+-exporting ATPase
VIVELGLLLATYLGSKLYEARKAEREGEESAALALVPKDEALPVKVSLASLALFAISPFVPAALPLAFAAYLYAAIPYMKNVETAIRRDRKVNVDVLFFFADALTLGARHYVAAAFGLVLIHSGKLTVKKAKDETVKQVTNLFKELPQTVWMRVDGVEVEVPLADVAVGDLVVVDPGSVVPVDGVIEQGSAVVDQSSLTGEAQPAEKEPGDEVFANTVVSAGRIQVRVTRSGKDTTSAQIADVLLNSVSYKTGVQLKGERWADQMSQPMLLAAGAILPFAGPVTTAVFINAHIGARIRLFAPLVTLRHISEASKLGVLVKDGRALEELSKVDTVLFDKTGTLTTDQPEVAAVATVGKYPPREILAYAATAQRRLSHPIARAILRKAEEEGVTPHETLDSNYTIGFGLSVDVGGRFVRVGSLRFFEQEGIRIPAAVREAQRGSHATGNTFILVGIDEKVEGTLELRPQIRPEARETIAQLRALGVEHIAIVSGDDEQPTRRLGEALGIDELYYNTLPERKAALVESLQAQGRTVGFVGDGINDTIALKKANVSISIAGASSIAKDHAEIILMDGTLTHVGPMMELAQRLDVNLRRSLTICLIPSGLNLLGAFVFNFNVLTALVLNSLAGTLGVTRAFYVRKKDLPGVPAESPRPAPEKDQPPDIPVPEPEVAALRALPRLATS